MEKIIFLFLLVFGFLSLGISSSEAYYNRYSSHYYNRNISSRGYVDYTFPSYYPSLNSGYSNYNTYPYINSGYSNYYNYNMPTHYPSFGGYNNNYYHYDRYNYRNYCYPEC
jgi:hypothetical protein